MLYTICTQHRTIILRDVLVFILCYCIDASKRYTGEVEFLDGCPPMAELLLILEVGQHRPLEEEEVPLGSSEGQSSRSGQFAVASQLQGWTLRLGGGGGEGGRGIIRA